MNILHFKITLLAGKFTGTDRVRARDFAPNQNAGIFFLAIC